MIINSNFHDYYDNVMKTTGVDKTCVYERKTDVVAVPAEPDSRRITYGNVWIFTYVEYYKTVENSIKMRGQLIGFCGKVQPSVELKDSKEKDDKYFYTAESLIDYLEKRHFLLESSKAWANKLFSAPYIKQFFQQDCSRFEKWFLELKVPVFLATWRTEFSVKDYRVIVNPNLKNLDFMKVKDPFTAFQEIHQYLSGILGSKEREIIEIDNKHRVESHGYDKWSFRKEPSKKK